MKKINSFLVLVVLLFTACSSASVEDNYKIVSFDTSITCDHCKGIMFDNLPKEAGIVDLKVEVETKVITILFNDKETTVENLVDKIQELGYTAYVIEINKYDGKF